MVVASWPPPTLTEPARTSVTVPRNTRAADEVMPLRSKCLTVVAVTGGLVATAAAINPAHNASLINSMSDRPCTVLGGADETEQPSSHVSRVNQLIVEYTYGGTSQRERAFASWFLRFWHSLPWREFPATRVDSQAR